MFLSIIQNGSYGGKMGSFYEKIEFPCGMKTERKAVLLGREPYLDNLNKYICPLHGKKCKR